MPKRKRTFNYRRRKYTKRRRYRAKRRFMRRPRIPCGIAANRKVCKLKYRDDWALIPTTADIPYKAAFSAASLYDPDRSGGGHQPKGFDQASEMWTHYQVLGAKITVRPFDPYTGSMLMFVVPAGIASPSNLGTVTEILEAYGCQYRMLGTSFTNTKPIKSYYSKKRIFGNTQNQDTNALFNSNPDEEYYWIVGAINGASGVTPTTVPVIIEIDYICLFTERKNIAQS